MSASDERAASSSKGKAQDCAEVSCGEATVPSQAASSSGDSELTALRGGHVGERAAKGVNSEIQRLLADQKEVREARKRVANELKNAQRRRRRLKHRARLLSTDDLVTVLGLRAVEQGHRKPVGGQAQGKQPTSELLHDVEKEAGDATEER